MAHPYHHARSSVRKWGGSIEDYLELHAFFDQSKALYPGPQHRAFLHHSAGIFLLERCFGSTITLSSGKVIPTRWVGEQHLQEDLGGRIPTFQDWLFGIAEAGFFLIEVAKGTITKLDEAFVAELRWWQLAENVQRALEHSGLV